MSQNSYLRKFFAQVSQIVFLADLTVLRLITTVLVKMSQNSYLRETFAQVSQNVFLADLTVLQLNKTVEAKCQKNHISASSVHKYHKSYSYLIWPFYDLLLLYEQKITQNFYLHEFCAQVSQIVFLADLTVLLLISTVWIKKSHKTHILAISVNKRHKSCF